VKYQYTRVDNPCGNQSTHHSQDGSKISTIPLSSISGKIPTKNLLPDNKPSNSLSMRIRISLPLISTMPLITYSTAAGSTRLMINCSSPSFRTPSQSNQIANTLNALGWRVVDQSSAVAEVTASKDYIHRVTRQTRSQSRSFERRESTPNSTHNIFSYRLLFTHRTHCRSRLHRRPTSPTLRVGLISTTTKQSAELYENLISLCETVTHHKGS